MEVDSKFFSLKAWKAQGKLFASLDKEQSQSRRLHLDCAELCGYIPEPPRMTQDLISTGEHTQFNFWTLPFDSAFSALGFYLLALALYSAPPCICMLSCWECESQSPALTVLVSNVSFPTVQRDNIPLPTLMIFDVLRHVFGQKGLAAAVCSASLQGQLWELCHLSDTCVTHRWVISESQVTSDETCELWQMLHFSLKLCLSQTPRFWPPICSWLWAFCHRTSWSLLPGHLAASIIRLLLAAQGHGLHSLLQSP